MAEQPTIDAQDAQVYEIKMDKNYVVVLTFPEGTHPDAACDTCHHLTSLLMDWVEGDYPDKFLVVGLSGGAAMAFHTHIHHSQPKSAVAPVMG